MINEPAARLNMVESQLRTNQVTNEAVLDAFLSVPRKRFVPEQLSRIAYIDDDIPLGNGRALIEPRVLGRLLQTAEIDKDETVLEIGCATGYATALLSQLSSRVVAIDSDAKLLATARANLAALGITNVALHEAPLPQGWPASAPYDVILLNGAVAEIPAAISDQLAEGGRLLGVVKPEAGPMAGPIEGLGQAVLMTRAEGRVSSRPLFDAGVHLLPGFAPPPRFVF